jgi:hypothetical protein
VLEKGKILKIIIWRGKKLNLIQIVYIFWDYLGHWGQGGFACGHGCGPPRISRANRHLTKKLLTKLWSCTCVHTTQSPQTFQIIVICVLKG